MRQIAASNESEVPLRLACLGERARKRNALYPDEAGQYWERERPETLCSNPWRSLRVLGGRNGKVGLSGGNNLGPKPEEKSDHGNALDAFFCGDIQNGTDLGRTFVE